MPARGERPHNSFSCLPKADFERRVRSLSNGARNHLPLPQINYLTEYLEQLGAASLLVESHYMDRHFVEEISLYYSRCLLPKKNSCARIHVFKPLGGGRLLHEPGIFQEILGQAARGQWKAGNDELQASYLGFIVVRPLASVPIGRTVLAPPPELLEDPAFTTVSYTVHFLGFSLEIKGLAFQQQDRAVGACATTAVWTALQQSLKKEGGRPPTPSAITEAAVRYSVPRGRPLPSTGLFIDQICEALRSFSFAPDVFEVKGSPEYFKLRLHAYLRSGIPVILGLAAGVSGHAVTAVGSRSVSPRCTYAVAQESKILLLNAEERPDVLEMPYKLRLRNLDYDHLYIHDDRLGPYASARLFIEDDPDTGPGRQLKLALPWPDGSTERLGVSLAAVPLYAKLRSAAHELLESALDLFPTVYHRFTRPGDELAVEFFFERSGHYLTDLYRLGAAPDRLAQFLQTIALSRYVGVIRWFLNDRPFLDTLWDTTDRLRETRFGEHLLGMISFGSVNRDEVDRIGKRLGVVVG